jgi:hypothetical protein
VHPQPLFRREVGERVEVVDGAGVRRAGVRDEEERQKPLPTILPNVLGESIQADAKSLVARDLADALGGEPGEERRLENGMVRLVRRVEDALQEIGGEALATRRDDGDEIGERPPRREHAAARLRRQPHDAGAPIDDVGLQLHESRGGEPDADVAVRRVRDEVGHRSVEQAAAGDVSEIAGRGCIEARRNDASEKEAQEALE